MDDRELLGLLAGEAPEPRGELADTVVRAGRRVRTRRRLTALGGAAALVVAAGLVLPPLNGGSSDDKAAAPALASGSNEKSLADSQAKSAPKQPGLASEQLRKDMAVDERVAVYAAALAPTPGDLYLVDGTAEGLGKSFRAALSAALPGRKIFFAAELLPGAALDGKKAAAKVVTLGEVEVAGDTASVLLGRDGAAPAPVRLTRRNDVWTVQPGT